MPIYAYRCASCGHAQDVLQKMSDAVLTVCPACGAAAYEKQVTAAGFQLKGSGWYVTDFKGGNQAAPKKEGEKSEGAEAAEAKPADKPAEKTEGKPAEGGTAAAKPAKPAEGSTSAPAPGKTSTPAAAPAPSKPAASPPSAGS